jgi:hypothetical protein
MDRKAHSVTADIFAAARRRWWLVVAGLLLTVGLVVGAQKLVGPSYEATASVLLLPSKTTLNGTTNPYLLLGGVNNARDAVMVRLSAAAGDEYPPNGPIQVTVATDPNSPAPLLELSAVSPTQEQSRAVLDTLLAKVAGEQAGHGRRRRRGSGAHARRARPGRSAAASAHPGRGCPHTGPEPHDVRRAAARPR